MTVVNQLIDVMKGNPIPIAKSFDQITLTFHLYQFGLK
jgi:hypothetical protein